MKLSCSRCGCTGFHYNHKRMRMECDSCGTPYYDPQQEQQMIAFERTYAQAMGHLRVGNWDHTIRLLTPLLEKYPTEQRLYVAILRAATQDFKDICMEDTANRRIAWEAWNKLSRLNGITNEMRGYGRHRYEKYRKERNVDRKKSLAWIIAAGLCFMTAMVFFGMVYYFMGILCLCGMLNCLYEVCQHFPVEVRDHRTYAMSDDQNNPFV